MSEQDKLLAQQALKRKRLSPDQADQLLEEARRTGRSFRDVALGRGLLSALDLEIRPQKKIETFQIVLMFGGLMMFMILVLSATKHFQDEKLARTELDRARAAMHSPESGAALAAYTTYLDLKPDDIAVLLERARLYRRLRKVELAIDDYQHAARLSPTLAPGIKAEIDSMRQASGRK